MQSRVLQAFKHLDERELTSQVISPLIETLHPGRVEYTHSSIEAGRDLVSFGQSAIDRNHVLCAQIKSEKFGYSARSVGEVAHVARVAKNQGVVTESGVTVFPHEVWVIAAASFAEQERRQVSNIIQDLEREGILLIGGEELSDLLLKHLPEVAQSIAQFSDPRTTPLLAYLTNHKESRAFGLSHDRKIKEFYITATIAPNAKLAHAALGDKITVEDWDGVLPIPCSALRSMRRSAKKPPTLKSLVRRFVMNNCGRPGFLKTFGIDPLIDYRCIEGRNISSFEASDVIECPIVLFLAEEFEVLQAGAKHATDNCPRVLGENVGAVLETCATLERLQTFLWGCHALNSMTIEQASESEFPGLRIQVPEPQRLLDLGQIVLIEGPPGCGKTTLLRMLAACGLETDESLSYVPCLSIDPHLSKARLREVVQKHQVGGAAATSSMGALVLDGLDEAPFDLSAAILRDAEKFSKIVVSTRTAHATALRDKCFRIGVAEFTPEELYEFFRRWFRNDMQLISKAVGLCDDNPDIKRHALLPLIATLIASLIEKGQVPATRSEIYDKRLGLLLSEWDKLRGVRRLHADEPGAKLRFLRSLAYRVHSSAGRRRTFTTETIREAYEASLGAWGYEQQFDKILEDLIVGSGVLTEERSGTYSFGHLSFQEHLCGKYLSEHLTTRDIRNLLGNDWWREPLNFWASARGDVSELVHLLLEDEGMYANVKQVAQIVSYAPFTSAGAVSCLKDLLSEGHAYEAE